MERRKALKNIGISFGAMAATPSLVSLLQSCQSQEAPWIPSFYTEDQGKFLKRLVDTFLPATGDLPSASSVNVHVFLDKYAKEVISVDDKPNARLGLETTMNALMKMADVENIASVKEEKYVEFLNAHLKKSKKEDEELWGQIHSFMKGNNKRIIGMDERLTIYRFLTQMRGQSIWAYKVSERVGENIMAYKPIPAEQKGCVDLQSTTGGMAWSLS